ncbi:hypothetical protein ACFYKX_18850 [Cytobacillus sp. FJAT-54145]|uniref:Uncharacterized protein n=1 Tax=Cytobacillus spartinae TaxID=3299023 RepID=A0ABW6KII5_9BACI
MEGIFFYWLFWLFWILTTFFVGRQKSYRLKVSIWLLLALILSLQSFTFMSFQMSWTSLFMLLTSYMVIARLKRRQLAYFIIVSFIVMLSYTSFMLFELFDPVWLIIDRKWLLALLIAYLSVMIQKTPILRTLTAITGSIHGDLLFAFIINKFSFPYYIGSFAFLDVIALVVALILAWSGLEKMAIYFEYHINHLEREKQKQS